MIIETTAVISAIISITQNHQLQEVAKNIGQKVAPLLISQAQRNEDIIKILKQLKLDPIQPPKDFDGVYAYTLVEYGVYKPEPILELFREHEIKKAFLDAYKANNPKSFLKIVEETFTSQETNINITPEVEMKTKTKSDFKMS